MKKVFFTIMVLFIMTTTAFAASAILAWDDTGHPEWGVKLYIGLEPGVYQWEHDAGLAVSQTTVDNLIPGETYYIVARAYDGTEYSGPSNEVELVVPLDVPTGLSVLPPLNPVYSYVPQITIQP